MTYMDLRHFVTILKKYTDYYIVPVMLSGSAVETIFSQYKHAVGGKLNTANYLSACDANLIKQTVSIVSLARPFQFL